jgi:hypothetical protein
VDDAIPTAYIGSVQMEDEAQEVALQEMSGFTNLVESNTLKRANADGQSVITK